MKLNPDCVRNILIAIDDNTDGETEIIFRPDSVDLESLSCYTAKEVRYNLLQCIHQGLVDSGTEFISGAIPVHGLTSEGHRFLESIRPASRWQRILKAVAKDLRSAFLGELVSLASESMRSDHCK